MADRPGPNKHHDNKQHRSAAEKAVGDLAGDFQHLIDLSVRNDWSTTELLEQLKSSKRFQRMFPGLVQKGGTINPSLGNTLGEAVGNYRRLVFTFQQATKGLFNFSPQQMGNLIANGISPDEIGTRVQAIANVRSNPGLLADFNAQLKAAGQEPLDEQGFLKFSAGVGSRDFYDTYEAAQLRAAGLNLDPSQALGVAQSLGTPGAPTDLSQIVQAVRGLGADVGPELQRAGVTDADLVLLQAGSDPNNLAPKLQQIINQRRASGTFVPGAQGHKGSGGGTAIFNDEGAASY